MFINYIKYYLFIYQRLEMKDDKDQPPKMTKQKTCNII